MQRNTLLGGLALLAAGGLIGAGAMISSNAMADTPSTPPANQLTMVNVGTDGDAVKCTFDGPAAAGLLPVPADVSGSGSAISSTDGSGQVALPVPADSVISGGGAISVGGGDVPIQIDPNNPPPGVVVSSGAISVDGSALPGDVKVLSSDDARDGTPEECAAMKAAMGEPPTGGTQIVIGATGASSGEVTAKP